MENADISLSYATGRTLEAGDAILEQYIIALFTSETEFSGEPGFGFSIIDYLGEANTPGVARSIAFRIKSITEKSFPDIQINSLNIMKTQAETIQIQLNVTVVSSGLTMDITREFV
jgi:hypothetical protein